MKVWHKGTFFPISFPDYQVLWQQLPYWVHYRYSSYLP
jgi:hypothetical protein